MEGPEEIFVNTYGAEKAYQTDTSGFQESIKPLHINATGRNLECAPSNALYFRAKACAAKSKSNQIKSKSKSLFSFSSLAYSDVVHNIHTDKL
jgi:hypothetical protein